MTTPGWVVESNQAVLFWDMAGPRQAMSTATGMRT